MIKLLLMLTMLFGAVDKVAFADQIINPPSSSGGGYSTIEDDGTARPQRTTVDFVGAGVSCVDLAGETSCTIAGAAGAAWIETEVDFGTTPVSSKRFTVTDAAVTGSSKVIVTQSNSVATGRVGNDAEWDSVIYAALAGSGSFTLTGFATGPIKGSRKIFYTVA